MAEHRAPEELLTFPCLYEYKVFGASDDERFVGTVLAAVCRVVPITGEAVRKRLSSGGRYQCVSVLVRLENGAQLSNIYINLRALEGVRYLL